MTTPANPDSTAGPQWQPGELRAHYRIVSALGAGGMGVVYRARDMRLERDVAVKVLPDALTSDPAARARLNREAQAASALNHPNICTIYEVGEAAGHAYIAMEYVEGRSLASMIPGDGLPLENVLRYGEQMADALAHAHERNVLHRDLKSANVIVTREGRAKILDFGLAKRIGAEIDAATLSQVSPLTQAGAIAGTLHYLPPEVLSGEPADARSDIWSLGVVLYEMASGTLPFQGRTSFEVTSGILREPPAPLPARVPPGLRAVIQRCLAKEPGQRYQRASEVRAALEAIGSIGSSPTIVAPDVTKPPAPAAQKSMIALPKWFLWVAGMIVLFGLFLMVVTQVGRWARRDKGAPPNPPGATVGGALGGTARLTSGGKPSSNAEANAYYERGLYLLVGQYELQRAQQMFQKALDIDPKFAEARAWFGFCYFLKIDGGESNDTKWLYMAEQELQRALQDDPTSGRVHSALAAVHFHQGRLALMGQEAQKAQQLNPNDLDSYIQLACYHQFRGDNAAARAQLEKLMADSPLFWVPRLNLADIDRIEGRYEQARAGFEKVLEQDPQNLATLHSLAHVYLETGETDKARAIVERIRREDSGNYLTKLSWALLYARENKRAEALRQMNGGTLKFCEVHTYFGVEAAEFFAMVGEADKALDWLERDVRNGDERIEWFKRDPLLASIRQHPRFKQITDSIEFRRAQRKN